MNKKEIIKVIEKEIIVDKDNKEINKLKEDKKRMKKYLNKKERYNVENNMADIKSFFFMENDFEKRKDDLTTEAYTIKELKKYFENKGNEQNRIQGTKDEQKLMANGVYLVIKKENHKLEYKKPKKYIKNKYSKERIDKKIDQSKDKKQIIYIGKADQTLEQRLRQYMLYKNHNGGRAIWYVNGSDDFYICWLKMQRGENAEKLEKKLLRSFKLNNQDFYPFANWKL